MQMGVKQPAAMQFSIRTPFSAILSTFGVVFFPYP